MTREFNIYVYPTTKNFSETLMELLGFFQIDGRWVNDLDNSAKVNDILKALTDIGYDWAVEFTTLITENEMRFTSFDEWSKWYND